MLHVADDADVIAAAWGAHRFAAAASSLVAGLRQNAHSIVSLGTTKDGSPQHPLHVRGDQPFVPYGSM